MTFTKPMIELVYEIRRTCPSELKPAVKLANPELFDELSEYYHGNASAVSKALIKELFLLSGTEWADRLLTKPTEANPKQQVKVYRGLTIFEDIKEPSRSGSAADPEKRKPKKIYRGRVVEN